MDIREHLSKDELDKIFTDRIVPLAFSGLVETERDSDPVIVMLGGQPGSGKTMLGASVIREYPNIIEINGDDLRKFHPDYERVMTEDPLRMPDVTAQASGGWVHRSLAYLKEQRADVLMETTMRSPEAVLGTLTEYKVAGYRTDLRMLAVPEVFSKLGALERYVRQVRLQGAGRWAASLAQDAAFANMPVTLQAVLDAGVADRLIVQQRDEIVLFDESDFTGDKGAIVRALAALESGRSLENITRSQALMWLNSYREISDFLSANQGAANSDVMDTYEYLSGYAEYISSVATAPET